MVDKLARWEIQLRDELREAYAEIARLRKRTEDAERRLREIRLATDIQEAWLIIARPDTGE